MAADCREEEAKAIRGGDVFDVEQCLENAIDRWAEKLAGILAKASDKGVSGDRCIPASCRPSTIPGPAHGERWSPSPASEAPRAF